MTQVRRARAAALRVPGSSANLGSGFDCLGLAVDRFLDVAFEPAVVAARALGADSDRMRYCDQIVRDHAAAHG